MQLKYRSVKVDNHSPKSTHLMSNFKSSLKKLLVSFKSGAKPAARGVYPALADLCPPGGRRVPRVLTRLVREMEMHLRADGIYRQWGDADEVEIILRNIDSVDLSSVDAHTLAECVKTVLWQIEEPLIPSDRLEAFVDVLSAEERESGLRSLVENLPVANRDTLEFMMGHWRKVLHHSLHNGLTVTSLAAVLAPFVAGFSNERVSIDVTEALLRIHWH